MKRLEVTPLVGLPMVAPGDDLARLLIDAIDRTGLQPRARDVLVVTQKIVSKAEGRYVSLASVTPSAEALRVARATGKDPRLVEVVLSEANTIIRTAPNVLIVETRHGIVMANAGIDQSNLADGGESERVLLLPADPDASARALKARLDGELGVELAVVVSDSVGRAWRLGTVGLAIGAAGLPSLLDLRGEPDLAGRKLQTTEVGFADAIAAAAVLAMGEAAEGTPAALVRGLEWTGSARPASSLVRPAAMDLFR